MEGPRKELSKQGQGSIVSILLYVRIQERRMFLGTSDTICKSGYHWRICDSIPPVGMDMQTLVKIHTFTVSYKYADPRTHGMGSRFE